MGDVPSLHDDHRCPPLWQKKDCDEPFIRLRNVALNSCLVRTPHCPTAVDSAHKQTLGRDWEGKSRGASSFTRVASSSSFTPVCDSARPRSSPLSAQQLPPFPRLVLWCCTHRHWSVWSAPSCRKREREETRAPTEANLNERQCATET